jgi:hypothetical protein
MMTPEPANCPTCKCDMTLVSTQPDQPGFVLQTLHCQNCNSTHRWMVRSEPLPTNTPRRPRKRLRPKILDRLFKAKVVEIVDAAALRKLEKMATKLQDTARKLTPGPSRQSLLEEVGKLRAQIVAMRSADSRPEPKGLKAKSSK